MKHTSESWQIENDAIIANIDGGYGEDGSQVRFDVVCSMYDGYFETLPNWKENANRIVDCVNSLAGIENPKEWVDRKKNQTYEIDGLKAERTRLQEHAQGLLVDLKQERARIAKLEEALKGCVSSLEAIKRHHNDVFLVRDEARLDKAKSLLS